ncbi:MAG: methyltransferase domain-containing protein [Acidimicrobiales bacterium]
MSDPWDPGQYGRFTDERAAPFHDLLDLLASAVRPAVVDLGCGTGALTAELHARVGASRTVGIDASASMLEQAERVGVDGVTFREGDIGAFDEPGSWDIVCSNAALHWVPDHPSVLGRWARSLRAGGQLAVQVPANVDHPSHVLLAEVAASAEFADAFDGSPPADPVLRVLRPEEYAEVLDRIGFAAQSVRLQVYGHRLASSADVVEWMAGTSLTRFRSVLDDATYARLVDTYRSRLLDVVGDRSPYFYAFKRILMWGRLPA